eukprot:3330005-Pleurochrysis_carterae.AAC.1
MDVRSGTRARIRGGDLCLCAWRPSSWCACWRACWCARQCDGPLELVMACAMVNVLLSVVVRGGIRVGVLVSARASIRNPLCMLLRVLAPGMRVAARTFVRPACRRMRPTACLKAVRPLHACLHDRLTPHLRMLPHASYPSTPLSPVPPCVLAGLFASLPARPPAAQRA